MVRKGKGIMKKHVFSAALALVLAFLLVLPGCITIVTPTDAPGPKTTEATAPTDEPATPAETESPTEAPETNPPETSQPPVETTAKEPETTMPPTEPPQPVFKTGLYTFNVDSSLRPDNALCSAEFYFNENGQFQYSTNYKDAAGSYNSFGVGNYVVEGKTVTCYLWFGGGGDPGWHAAMFVKEVFTLESETTLRTETLSKGESLVLAYSTDKERTDWMSFSDATSMINTKYLFNKRGETIPSDLKLPVCTALYTFPGQAGKLLGDAELALYENGRCCISLSFTDGAGGSSMVGNYVKDDKQIHCYVWFIQAGDPMFYVTPDTVYDFQILENDQLLLNSLNDTNDLHFKRENDQSRLDYFTKYNNFATAIEYGYISKALD
jgi:hypothetical protein